MKKLNLFFFDSESISFHDMFWFYGTLLGILLVLITVVIPALIINLGGLF